MVAGPECGGRLCYFAEHVGILQGMIFRISERQMCLTLGPIEKGTVRVPYLNKLSKNGVNAL